jgi:hypothetical protein
MQIAGPAVEAMPTPFLQFRTSDFATTARTIGDRAEPTIGGGQASRDTW